MITRKKMNIPIFDYGLTVIIYDNWEEVMHLFNDDNKFRPKAITKFSYGNAVVGIDVNYGGSIVHEAEHVKNAIWEYIGYKPQVDNDEVDAYLLTYIYKKITDVYYRHKDS